MEINKHPKDRSSQSSKKHDLLRRSSHRDQGFTLIEVMIVVAIIGILASVALPSYQSYIRKSKRADARALLQAASITQEKYRLDHATFASTTTELSPTCPPSGTCLSDQGHYSLATSTPAQGSSYTLTASAVSASQLADTNCTAITYSVSGSTITYGPSNACWGK